MIAATTLDSPDVVAVIEDNITVRDTTADLLESVQLTVKRYASATAYLDDPVGRAACGCIVLDVRLPVMSGLELQRLLSARGEPVAIVFVTGFADVRMAVDAMRGGAIDVLEKPYTAQQLIDSVHRGLALYHERTDERRRRSRALERMSALTPRERDVLTRLQRGLRTKQIAAELGIGARTAEEYRANLMQKMSADSLAELLQMCAVGEAEP